jgi:hypothetical protein
MTHLNRARLMRFLKLKSMSLREDNRVTEADEIVDVMNKISSGKYNIKWYDLLIPALLFVFCGMVISLILIGVMLEV